MNGEVKQDGDLEQMIWNVPEIIWKLSEMVELAAGDIIMTGTPAGVSALQPGHKLECEVEGVGKVSVTIGPKVVSSSPSSLAACGRELADRRRPGGALGASAPGDARCASLGTPPRMRAGDESYTTAVMPPSTNRMCPLTNDDASLREEDRGALQLLDLAPAARGRARADPGGEFLVRHQRRVELGAEIARRNAVRRDAVLGELRAHRLGEHLHRALARRVGRDRRAAELRHHRADIDDLAARRARSCGARPTA